MAKIGFEAKSSQNAYGKNLSDVVRYGAIVFEWSVSL